MTKMLIDIDDEALEAAMAALGTKSAEDTVNTALREAVAVRRRANGMAKLNHTANPATLMPSSTRRTIGLA